MPKMSRDEITKELWGEIIKAYKACFLFQICFLVETILWCYILSLKDKFLVFDISVQMVCFEGNTSVTIHRYVKTSGYSGLILPITTADRNIGFNWT